MQIYIGTSGFQYKHWNNGVFYPRGIKDRLRYALSRMTAIEINSSFYRIPPPDTVETWARNLPAGVRMVLKAPQSVTHRRRLKLESEGNVRQGRDLLNYFIDGVLRIPQANRGPALLQLPESMAPDLTRLEQVLQLFSRRGLQVALEVRHAAWCNVDTLALLEYYQATLVASDWPEFHTPLLPTSQFIYLRRHGPGALYASGYDDKALRADIDSIWRLAGANQASTCHQIDTAYVFFNNDIHGHAPRDAMRMMELLEHKR
ncbi:DUF72 domain-containing protein [Noviherbaspirillum sp. CPCC 100848]|uniref:DUF72 domain-containing protein n=1 Tax=Noviherbaspirillum album TaxID=3080276 RepID=A0ABU6JJC9_9BURK|nr:DUF72 domain-containing protein [Noviherbaspirillum sp. CPCC 100848]MEC4723797.1 DUF72 domain-containing protein [Noviherbaspirillum sp. CPCC 100848]